MKRSLKSLICAMGAVTALSAGPALAVDIQTKKACKAANGMASRIDGAMTCIVPIREIDKNTDRDAMGSCTGELINGGTFCRIIIDNAYKKAAPDCDAVDAAKADPDLGYEIWLAEAKRPHTDAWKCEKLKDEKTKKTKR